MMPTETITYTTTLSTLTCGECSIPFAVPSNFHQRVKNTGALFWCPNGHKIGYGETENDRLRRRLDAAETRRRAAWDQAQAAQRSASAYKGQVTRIRKRVANGVCPCCRRTFANLARHMSGQHPGWEADAVAEHP